MSDQKYIDLEPFTDTPFTRMMEGLRKIKEERLVPLKAQTFLQDLGGDGEQILIRPESLYHHTFDCRFITSNEIGEKCTCGAMSRGALLSRDDLGRMLSVLGL